VRLRRRIIEVATMLEAKHNNRRAMLAEFSRNAVLPRGERYGAILVPFFRSSGAAT